jgi:hypothetical protein
MYILNITTVTYLTFTFVSRGYLNIVQFQFLNCGKITVDEIYKFYF